MKELTEDRFKTMLQMRDKCKRKKLAIGNVYEVATLTGNDVLHRIMQSKVPMDLEVLKKEFDGVISYCNEQLDNTGNLFSCKVYYLQSNFGIIKEKKKKAAKVAR